jgi:ubiquitin carboxyl-terminal hydrolase 7
MEQQDSQEFWKLLLPVLKLPALTDLYQGAYEDYISAVDGSERERRLETPFLDLSLEVAGRPTALNALSELFGAPELLSEAEGNGWRPEKGAPKVDALKGSLLRAQGLPSLLQLHLKRFQYDWEYDSMSKLNTRFAFPAELDMTNICVGSSGKETSDALLYDLQSIVVHVGDYGSGHYYSYVRPDVRTNVWYRFDDDRVAQVSFKEVVKDAYGGRTVGEEKQNAKKGFLKRLFGSGASYGWGGSKSSAYMLQYVKRSDVEKLYGKS